MKKDRTVALILAGGRLSERWSLVAKGTTHRALLRVGERTMLETVVDAVRGGTNHSPAETIILVAGDLPVPQDCVAVPEGRTLVETLMNGIDASYEYTDHPNLLVVTADLPFLTADSVADFYQSIHNLPGDFYYPIVPLELCLSTYPDLKRTSLRLSEGRFTGGNLVLLNRDTLRTNRHIVADAARNRKSPLRLVKLLGLPTLLRLLGSRLKPDFLTIAHLEAAIGRSLGNVTCRAFVSKYAGIGVDIDRPADLLVARQIADSRGMENISG